MLKKHVIAGLLASVLVVAGAGCGAPGGSDTSGDDKGQSLGQTIKKELRGEGDKDAALSASEQEKAAKDAEEIVKSVFGNDAKLSARMSTDLVVKGMLSIGYTLSKPAQGSQQDALERAFKKAGYSIIDGQEAKAFGEDQSGGLVGEKRNIALYAIYEQGSKEMGFMAMSVDQNTYLQNSDDEDSENNQ